MSRWKAWSIDGERGAYVAKWAVDLREDEKPLTPAAAWQVIERLLARPRDLNQLMELARNLPGAGGRGGTSIRRSAFEQPFLSGRLVLVAQQTSAPTAQGDRSEPVVEQIRLARVVKTWVEMEVVDDLGKLMAGERYQCMLPDGKLEEGYLDARGRVRFDGIDPGTCVFTLPDLQRDDWRLA